MMMRKNLFCYLAALMLLLSFASPASVFASSAVLSSFTTDNFVPVFNEILEQNDLSDSVDDSDPYMDEEGAKGFYVCSDTYLMLRSDEDSDSLQSVTLTVMKLEDTEKALQLVNSTIATATEEGQSADVVKELDACGMLSRKSSKESRSLSRDGLHYTLETLDTGFLLSVETE